MADNPYYIDERGFLIMGTYYTGQTFTEDHKYEYYEEKVKNAYVSSVNPDGTINTVIS